MEMPSFKKSDKSQCFSLIKDLPQCSDNFDWEKLDGYAWSQLLSRHPQFSDKCAWRKLDCLNWIMLLLEQPQFSDKCAWEIFNGYAWCLLLLERPEYSNRCDWKKLDGYAWSRLLQERPEYSNRCDWKKLDGYAWSQLLRKRPEFLNKCNWQKLDKAERTAILMDRLQFPYNFDKAIKKGSERQLFENSQPINFVPVILIALLWCVGCIVSYLEKMMDAPYVVWWTLLCSWNGIYYSMRKRNPDSAWKWNVANIIAWILLMPCTLFGYMIYRGVF